MIYILGVEHFTVQLPNKINDATKVEKFIEQVKSICKEKKINLIAEESSKDALSYQNIDSTHIGKIVSELGVEYMLCDPGINERNRIGVKQRDIIASELSIPFPPITQIQEDKINELAKEFDRKREKYWLDQIKLRDIMNNKEILLICGFEHVDSFIELAKKENCVVQKIN